MAVTSATELQPVVDVTSRLQALLDRARGLKLQSTVEPPLPTAALLTGVDAIQDDFKADHDQSYRYATVETAAREIFYSLISSVDIHDPAFVEVWNLLDILLLCGDEGKCTPELVCWLIEELLDSQTTHGCRTVFDYLESRRERLAQKDFHKKNLVFLRSCNELLRRLSRAEDAIFCGRVFFFLFQTFPLGDKSSVNLRGEFHVENTTKFEVDASQAHENGDKMELDPEPATAETEMPEKEPSQPPAKSGSKVVPIKAPPKKAEEVVLSNSELYPIFWRLQQDFSDPTRLFATEHFQTFKKGLAQTISKFKSASTVVETKSAEGGLRGTKRKLGQDGLSTINGESGDQLVDNYNPKYLTSRDLFDLELSDLAFQRHILVQALILIDFLLSLTDKAKKMLATLETPNKSLLYNFLLNDEDTKWATTTRTTITNYLSQSKEGRLFNRMVETVLARDKNWVRWKIEGCPSIVRDPVSTESEVQARQGAREATRIRRVPEKPAGSMDLSFLSEGSGGGLEALRDPARYTVLSIPEIIDGIKNDELDLEMAMDDEERTMLQNSIANKRWRVLRQARATRLGALDKVEPGKDLDSVFRPRSEPGPDSEDVDTTAVDTSQPDAAAEHVDATEIIVAEMLEPRSTAPADDIVVESTIEGNGADAATKPQSLTNTNPESVTGSEPEDNAAKVLNERGGAAEVVEMQQGVPPGD